MRFRDVESSAALSVRLPLRARLTGQESFGIVLLEMAAGVPIVASDILHGYKQVVQRNFQGLLVEPRNERAPSPPRRPLTALARRPAEPRHEMGEAGRAPRPITWPPASPNVSSTSTMSSASGWARGRGAARRCPSASGRRGCGAQPRSRPPRRPRARRSGSRIDAAVSRLSRLRRALAGAPRARGREAAPRRGGAQRDAAHLGAPVRCSSSYAGMRLTITRPPRSHPTPRATAPARTQAQPRSWLQRGVGLVLPSPTRETPPTHRRSACATTGRTLRPAAARVSGLVVFVGMHHVEESAPRCSRAL